MELNEGLQIGEVVPGHPIYHANVIKSYGNERLCGRWVTLPTGGPPPPCKQALTVMF